MTDKHKLWVEKYRPQTLDEYVFHDERMKAQFLQMIRDKTMPQLLLTGIQGSGKTTLARILIRDLGVDDSDVLYIDASTRNSVDTIREEVLDFVSTFAMGTFKVVHLEEADRLTPSAQDSLRRVTEDFSDNARFLVVCNHENKIIPPLKSRFHHYRFTKPDRDAATEYAAKVLICEKVEFTLEQLDGYIAVGYPDIRKIINLLQQNTVDGKLLPLTDTATADYKFALLDLIETGDWIQARKVVCEQVAAEEWEDVYRFLYENLYRAPSFSQKDKWEAGIVVIADHLYKHSIVADPEINAAAMFIRLGQL